MYEFAIVVLLGIGTFKLIDKYQMANGTYVDGSPPANVWGCSSHWHENNPRYGLHGGLVAGAFFEHGVRFMEIDSKGRIVTICVGIQRPRMKLFDPRTLEELRTLVDVERWRGGWLMTGAGASLSS